LWKIRFIEDAIEKYFGCECYCLDTHIAHMLYFPPNKEMSEEENVIYFTVKTRYLFDRVLPPFNFNFMDWIYEMEYYFHFHILRRLPIALNHIFNSFWYYRKDGILDCFNFQNKDLSEMKNFLSLLTNEELEKYKNSNLRIKNEECELMLSISRDNEDFPYCLGWKIQFLPKKIFSGWKDSLKYIFGRYDDEQHFEIKKEDAKIIKGIITVIEGLNKEKYEEL